MNFLRTIVLLTGLLVLTYGLSGCSQAAPPSAAQTQSHADHPGHKDGDEHKEGDGHDHAKSEHQHGEWWCAEHGVPEAECAQCDAKLAASFQKKGDWCKEHDRPDSQCFICHPDTMAEYAAKYEAKYGKQPPKPELN